MRNPRNIALAVFAVLALVWSGGAHASFQDYARKMCQKESGCRMDATNPHSTATGLYQFTQSALVAEGLFKPTGKISREDYGSGEFTNGVWVDNRWGIKSREDFMRNREAQDYVLQRYTQRNWEALQRNGGASFVGKEVKGVKLNEAAILSCAHFLGAGGCAEYLKTGKINGEALSNHPDAEALLLKRMAEFSQVDVSDVIGQNTAVDNSGYIQNSPAGDGAVGAMIACDPDVAEILVDNGKARVEAAVALASGKMPSGSGGASAVGAPSGGSGTSVSLGVGYSRMEQSFGQMSCLERLMSGSLDIFFSPPSIGDLLGMLEKYLCNKADEMFAKATQPINETFTETADLGGFLPIQGLGRMSAGINTRITTGSRGGGLLSGNPVNVRGLERWDQSIDQLNSQATRIGNGLDSLFK